MRIFSILALVCCISLAACTGASDTGSLEIDKADSRQVAADTSGKTEIPVGMSASRVAQILGTADSIDNSDAGRQIWRYSAKRAEFIYVSNRDNVQTLVIGGYVASPPLENPQGLPLQLMFVIDSSKNVADFNFSQMAF